MDTNGISTNEDVLNSLPSDAVREALLKIIAEKVPSTDYQLHIEGGSEKGENYMGITSRLTVSYKNDESKEQTLGIFIKIAPDNPQRRQHFFVKPCFDRETLMYTEYLPLLKEFQESKGIPPEDQFNNYSDCFHILTTEPEETLFMEDLSLKGYTMFSRFLDPSADLVKTLLKALAKFHALSFAIKDQWPERYSKYTQLEEVLFGANKGPMFENFLNKLDGVAFEALSEKGDEQVLQQLKDFLAKKGIVERVDEYVKGANAEPYAVVCHGDCWNNNFLFKFEGQEVVDAKLIDLQLSRYASPVTDLMYYLFSCTSKSLRDEHYQEFLDTYYMELSTFLQRLDSDPTVLFPQSAFEQQLKQFGAFGFTSGLLVIPTITKKKEDVPDLDEISRQMSEGNEDVATVSMSNGITDCKSKIRDMILDLINLGYIS